MELGWLCREEEDCVDVELIVRYATKEIYGTLLAQRDVNQDVGTAIHKDVADQVEQVRQLALKEDWTLIAMLATTETGLPLGFEYILPLQFYDLYEQPLCKASIVVRRFASAHKLGWYETLGLQFLLSKSFSM